MENDNGMTNTVSEETEWHKVDSKSLFNLMQARHSSMWKVGRNRYLLTGHELLAIRTVSDFYHALCAHGFLLPDEIITGKELRAVLKICKKYAIDFQQHLLQKLHHQAFEAYQKIKRNIPERTAFFRRWMLSNQ